MKHDENEGGFISHLAELRKRLIHSFIFLIIFFIGCYFFAEHLYGFLVDPFAQAVKNDGTDRRLIFTALQETFLTYLKISFDRKSKNLLEGIAFLNKEQPRLIKKSNSLR